MAAKNPKPLLENAQRIDRALKEGKNLIGSGVSVMAGSLFALWAGRGSSDMWRFPSLFFLLAALTGAVFWTFWHFKIFKPRYSELLYIEAVLRMERDAARLGLEATLKSLLRNLLSDTNLLTPDCRISAYYVTEAGFLLVARVSHNPTLQIAGRKIYPFDSGVIGQAWKKGERHKHVPSGLAC